MLNPGDGHESRPTEGPEGRIRWHFACNEVNMCDNTPTKISTGFDFHLGGGTWHQPKVFIVKTKSNRTSTHLQSSHHGKSFRHPWNTPALLDAYSVPPSTAETPALGADQFQEPSSFPPLSLSQVRQETEHVSEPWQLLHPFP
jgi:hypothetical protein